MADGFSEIVFIVERVTSLCAPRSIEIKGAGDFLIEKILKCCTICMILEALLVASLSLV